MIENFRSLFFLILMVGSFTWAGEVFSPAALKKYSAAAPSSLFRDPLIACRLIALMGNEKFKAIQKAMVSIEILEPPDVSGAFPFRGGAPGLFTILEGFILIHPDGRLWVGYLHDERIEYYSNSGATRPESLNAWAKRFGKATWQDLTPKATVLEKNLRRCASKK